MIGHLFMSIILLDFDHVRVEIFKFNPKLFLILRICLVRECSKKHP